MGDAKLHHRQELSSESSICDDKANKNWMDDLQQIICAQKDRQATVNKVATATFHLCRKKVEN